MGGVCRAIVASGAIFGVALLSAGISSAAEPVQLKSRLGDWCLDGPNGNNAATVVNPCNGSNSQRWVLNSAGQIESAAFPGRCVSIGDAADNTPAMRESVTSTNVFVHVEATRASAGLGLLPCFMADRHDDLLRVLPDDVALQLTYWLVARSETLRRPEVAAFIGAIRDRMADQRDVLLGEH